MISPNRLANQRRVVRALDVDKALPRPRTPRLACVCGHCRACRRREWMRAYRAANPGPPQTGLIGPRFDAGRLCDKCKAPVADQSKTGLCSPCQKSNPKSVKRARRAYFWDGGGI